jgi:hypothetical protein
MDPIKVFFLNETDRQRIQLRRFVWSSEAKCSGPYSYHNAVSEVIEVVPIAYSEDGIEHSGKTHRYHGCSKKVDDYKGDPRWPTHCACGYEFKPEDQWQVFAKTVMVRSDTGEETTLLDAPVGAVWDAWWFGDSPHYRGPDGRTLVCKVPSGHVGPDGVDRGHDWIIDGRASNCTMPEDTAHKCWVRHGTPEDGSLHVDKNGHTCAAGGGSIATKGWHGFLHKGRLVG